MPTISNGDLPAIISYLQFNFFRNFKRKSIHKDAESPPIDAESIVFTPQYLGGDVVWSATESGSYIARSDVLLMFNSIFIRKEQWNSKLECIKTKSIVIRQYEINKYLRELSKNVEDIRLYLAHSVISQFDMSFGVYQDIIQLQISRNIYFTQNKYFQQTNL